MQRNNIVLDELKIKKAKGAYDLDATKEVRDPALTELQTARRRKGILALKGKLQLDIKLSASRRLG